MARVINLTKAIDEAKSNAGMTIMGHVEPWEDHIDWRDLRVKYTHATYKGKIYLIGRFGLESS